MKLNDGKIFWTNCIECERPGFTQPLLDSSKLPFFSVLGVGWFSCLCCTRDIVELFTSSATCVKSDRGEGPYRQNSPIDRGHCIGLILLRFRCLLRMGVLL